MMAFRRYSRDDLLHLRESVLVQKPENLPPIEQWLEYVYVDKDSREKLRIHHSDAALHQPQNGTASRRQPQSKAGGSDASPMGNFSTGARPNLLPTRSQASRTGGKYIIYLCGEFARRRLMRTTEDISLGPPRTMFPSSRNVSKAPDFGDKVATSSGDAVPGDEQEAPRSRFFGGDRSNRKSMNDKEGRDNRESWTAARERRTLGGDDEHKQEGRYGRRDRDQDGERRNGYGEKHDSRWGERRQNGERQGGWREREREKKDRDLERGGHAEREPEWMEDPAPAGAEDDLRTMGMPRNQEQFQKWKEAMSGKKSQIEETGTSQEEPMKSAREAAPAKPAPPLKLEGIVDKPFGGWSDNAAGSTLDSAPTPAKSGPGKKKGSRFASMFSETQLREEAPLPETSLQKAANEVANGSAEDEAGFKRILQMLGGTGISQPGSAEIPSPPPPKTATNGAKQKSRFTGFFDQTPKSPERMQSPPEANFKHDNGSMLRGSSHGVIDEPASMFGGALPESRFGEQHVRNQGPSNPIPPEPMQPMNGNRDQQPPGGRANDIFIDHPPSRGAATPDINIQNLLASQRAQRSQQGQDKNSEFLLNLLQTKGSRPPSQQARPESNFPLWLDQPPNMPEPHAPKPRAPPPPGLFEDQFLRNVPPEPPRLEQQPLPPNEILPQRRSSQRAPPGFYDEQNLYLQQQQQQQAAQRRNFTEPPQHHQHQPGRRMSGHPNLPQQMQIPQQYSGGPPLPEYLQSPAGGQGPPPGFNPQMPRHPPGFHNIPNIPNIFQAPQQQGGREPPGFASDNISGRMPGGGGGGIQLPPNAPPGFFGGPQGIGPSEFMGQMRSPTEGIPAGVRRGFDGGGYDGAPRR